MGKIVHGQQGRHRGAAPGEIAGRERRLPIVEMQAGGPPAVLRLRRHLRGGKAQPRKSNVVVVEFGAVWAHIGASVAIEQFLAQDDVDD